MLHVNYRNDPKFSDRKAWANSADPDQTAPLGAPLGAVWSGSALFVIPAAFFGVHYSLVKPSCSNFRVITANVWGVLIFRIFTVLPISVFWPLRTRQIELRYLSHLRRLWYFSASFSGARCLSFGRTLRLESGSFCPLSRSPLSRFAPLWNFISSIIISALKVV